MAEENTETPAEMKVGEMITKDTPRHARTIGSKDGPTFSVQVPAPFSAGPITLSAGQAAVLNQTLAENVSNNLRQKLVEGQRNDAGEITGPHTEATAQALVDEYVSEYQFGGRRSGGGGARITDPVEREARKLARAAATDFVKGQGLKVKDVDMAPIIDAIWTKNEEVLMAKAKKIVAAASKEAELDMGNLPDLG